MCPQDIGSPVVPELDSISRITAVTSNYTQAGGGGVDRFMAFLPWLFLMLALPMGILYATLVPLDQVQDEAAHIARAAALLQGDLLGVRQVVTPREGKPYLTAGLRINAGLAEASVAEIQPLLGPFEVPSTKTTKAEYLRLHGIRWSHHRQFVQCPNSLQYFPVFYLPAAAGLGLARWVGFSPYHALVIGRLSMLLAYLALGFMALRIARFGKPILFTVLCLPMSIDLAASYNQDAQLVAATALTGALLSAQAAPILAGLRVFKVPILPRLAGLIASIEARTLAAWLFALVVCSKPPYGLLLTLTILPLGAPGLWRRILRFGLLSLPSLVWVALYEHFEAVRFHATHPYLAGRWWSGSPFVFHNYQDPARNIQVLLAVPSRFFIMVAHLNFGRAFALQGQAIALIGQNNVTLSFWEYLLWFFAIFCAWMACMAERPVTLGFRALDRLFVAGVVVLSVLALELAIYISWSMLGATQDIGVTGRYFLLFPPFLLLIVPRFGAVFDRWLEFLGGGRLVILLTLPALVMAGVDFIVLPAQLAHLFYLGT